jgi:peptidoglycan/xylan/chitin deacetylase (PgdA/CDA1 family)
MNGQGGETDVKTDTLTDRIANRVVRHFPGPRVAIAPQRPIVSFTFDDVPETAFTNGAPILEAVDARGTFYLAGGLVGQRRTSGSYISMDSCRELGRRGHELACHTFSHKKLSLYDRQALAADLDRNAAFLSACDGRNGKRNFAVPYTMSWPPAQRELRRRFLTSRGGMRGINRGPVDPFNLAAYELRDGGPDLDTLAPILDDLCASSGWLVFFTHDVTPEPTEYGCTQARFAALAHAVLERGCTIATIEGAVDLLGLRAMLTPAGAIHREEQMSTSV